MHRPRLPELSFLHAAFFFPNSIAWGQVYRFPALNIDERFYAEPIVTLERKE
ncbi:hypothetical protein JCM19232_3901 [Vibrio ishigakensis]|uniref:Uncharacterized protein n=1 Tax=Vibrio ishigakensis TaxID=1481914 RepID=A0A0B8PDQ7_9VIBR|nr:hypothetical protein JCM19232_3901 [Vibrio ishigakensis]